MERKRPRERTWIGMIDDLKEGSYVKMKGRADDRVAWRLEKFDSGDDDLKAWI